MGEGPLGHHRLSGNPRGYGCREGRVFRPQLRRAGRSDPHLAVEPRIHAAVLNVGGLRQSGSFPEADPSTSCHGSVAPLLMINGQYDIVFPYETAQLPMFELLGTPQEDKKHYVSPAAHLVPMDEVIRETLAWFDKYLGVPGGQCPTGWAVTFRSSRTSAGSIWNRTESSRACSARRIGLCPSGPGMLRARWKTNVPRSRHPC
jgi:hypothetical protein